MTDLVLQHTEIQSRYDRDIFRKLVLSHFFSAKSTGMFVRATYTEKLTRKPQSPASESVTGAYFLDLRGHGHDYASLARL